LHGNPYILLANFEFNYVNLIFIFYLFEQKVFSQFACVTGTSNPEPRNGL